MTHDELLAMKYDELLGRVARAALEPHSNVITNDLVLALRALREKNNPIYNPNFPDSSKPWCFGIDADGVGYYRWR